AQCGRDERIASPLLGENEPRAQYHREGTQSGCVKVYDPAHDRSGRRTPMTRASLLASAVALVLTIAVVQPAPAAGPAGRSGAPPGQIASAIAVALAPGWSVPAETPGVITPFLTLYALHDALVKPMPGNAWAPGLAESWTTSKDGLTYE